MPARKPASKPRGRFVCPDCGFKAKHAMGLGRHRSARHGVMSQRQQRAATRGGRAGWLSREQAATYAGVHYNTIRGWERSGLLQTSKRPGVRGMLVRARDLDVLLADRASPGMPVAGGSGADIAAVRALEARFAELIDGLEALVATLKGPQAGRTRATPRRKPAPRRTATAARKAAKRPARKRTAPRRARRR